MNKPLNTILLTLMLLMMCAIVYIFWYENRNMAGIFTGLGVAVVAPLIGWLFYKRRTKK